MMRRDSVAIVQNFVAMISWVYNLLNLWVNQVSIIDGFFHLCQEASSPRVLDVVIFVIDILIFYDIEVRAI